MRETSAFTRCLAGIAVALPLTACSSPHDAVAATSELRVFAASSLTAAFTQIGSDFEAANPGTTVTFNFGSSGDLASAIDSEGTADVFASASGTYMDDVSEKVGVHGRADFVQNELVVITPPDNPANIMALEDLTAPGLQVVLATEGVPVGDYARRTLEAAGIADDVLANVVSNEEDDASVVGKIAAGEADAAIVYVSDVTSDVKPDVNTVPIPDEVNVIATYPIAVVSTSTRPGLADSFVTYVTGPSGQATLADFGFLPPLAA
jgi:molybdate transport system substrate-binding protein